MGAIKKLWRIVFGKDMPPTEDPCIPGGGDIEGSPEMGQLRQAQQRLVSSSRVIQKKANENVEHATKWRNELQSLTEKKEGREDGLRTAEDALRMIRGGKE
jgi:hypothetical protein